MVFVPEANAPRCLADLLHIFHDDDPQAVYLHILNIDHEGEAAITKTRKDLLNDAKIIASKLLQRGGSIRRPGERLVNCSILARSSYLFFVHFLGAIFNGWTPVLLSTRNSAEAIEELLRVSESRHLIVDGTLGANIEAILAKLPLIIVHPMEQPDDSGLNLYNYPEWRAWSDEEVDKEIGFPGWYLHTSGSTDGQAGHPKLIPLSHKQIFQRISDLSRTRYDNRFIIGTMPMFHTIGLLVVAMWPISTGAVSVIVESKHPVTGEAFVDVLKRYPSSLAMIPPAILDEIVALGPESMQIASSAHRIIYGGAPLSQTTGDTLASFGVKMVTAFGTTETGGLSLMDVASDDPRDWRYTRFLSSTDIAMKPLPESPELQQMIIRPGPYLASALVNHDNPAGFLTGDIWKEHPTKPGLWLHMGRKGSVTVLSTGEKTDDVQLESLLVKDTRIQAAVVFGEGHQQNGVILLPKDSTDAESFLYSVWPTIEHANTIIPQHSRLTRPLVLIADPEKGIVFTDKSTINRKRTIALYEEEIKAAYSRLETGVTAYELPHNTDEASVLRYVRRVVFGILGRAVDDDSDLFDEGMDSLTAISCRSSLVPLLKVTKPGDTAPRNLLYHHPTINSLTRYIRSPHASLNGIVTPCKINSIIKKLMEDLPRRVPGKNFSINRITNSSFVIVLTGSTGSFGSQILSQLLQDQRVAQIFCLNRKGSLPILERHQKSMGDPALLETYRGKVKFLEVDLSDPQLALPADAIHEIQATATHVIHCAWEVNFNHALDRFVNVQIAGVRRLMDVCLSCGRAVPPRFIFISSISAVTQLNGGDAVPEEILDESFMPIHQGYSQSKYIAETILAKVSNIAGLPVTIIRIGQLSGSSKSGAWNMNEYIPVLLQTGMALGKIPDTVPDVRWIPSDIAAGIVLDIVLRDEEDELTVYHIESPHLLPGRDIIRWIEELSDGAVKAISSSEWLDTIQEASPPVPGPGPGVTATKLLDFFHSWLDPGRPSTTLKIDKTSKVSDKVHWGPITKDIFSKYYEFVRKHASD